MVGVYRTVFLWLGFVGGYGAWFSAVRLVTISQVVTRCELRISDFVGLKRRRVAEHWFRVALIGLSRGAAETEPSRFRLTYFPGGSMFDAVVASAERAEVSR